MIIKAIVSYALSAILVFAAAAALVVFFKKTERRLSVLHMIIGSVSFFAVAAIMFLLLMYAFSETSTTYMTTLMSERTYKISIAVLFFAAVGLVRYFAVNAAYFGRVNTDKGMSFMAGYGIAGSVAMTLYSLFMLIYISVMAISSRFVTLGADSTLDFENGARISVFTPFYSNLLTAAVFVVYFVLILIIGSFMDQHSKLPYSKRSTFLMYLITNACEIMMICIVLFAGSSAGVFAVSILSLCITALAAVSLRMLYKYKETLPYDRQFD